MNMDIKEILFAYSEDIRLRIMLLLKDSEICVNCIVAAIGSPQSTISRHIGILRRAGIILANRKGQNTYYTANTQENDLGSLNRELLKVYHTKLGEKMPYLHDKKNLLKQKDICTVECKVA